MHYEQLIENLKDLGVEFNTALSQEILKNPKCPDKILNLGRKKEAISLAIYCLKEYIESWSCPMCGFQTKIPHDHKDKRKCPRCLNSHMFPYGYLEQERMTKQMTLLLNITQYYSTQGNGAPAKEALRNLAKVGQFNPENTCANSQK